MTRAACSPGTGPPEATATGDDPPVITPGGPRPRGSVHGVGPAQTVVQQADGTLAVVPTADLEQRKGSASMPDDLVLTPGGPRARSQVHLIESGTVLDGADGRLRKLGGAREMLADFGVVQQRTAGVPLQPGNVTHLRPGAAPAFGSGWITYASWRNGTGTPVSSFATTWVVPDPPATAVGTAALSLQRHPELDDDLPARAAVGRVPGWQAATTGPSPAGMSTGRTASPSTPAPSR